MSFFTVKPTCGYYKHCNYRMQYIGRTPYMFYRACANIAVVFCAIKSSLQYKTVDEY